MTEQSDASTTAMERRTRRRPKRFVVGKVSDFPASGRMLIEVNHREIGVFLVDGEFHAVMNRCPHLGGPLCYGQIVKPISSDGPGHIEIDQSRNLLTCPWHNWEFDLTTGQSFWDPKNLHARPFPVDRETGAAIAEAIESGSTALVKGPFQAEMVEVAVEDEYLVLSLKSPSSRAAATDSPAASAEHPDPPVAPCEGGGRR